MTKKVSFGLKPTKPLPPAADSWVENRAPVEEPLQASPKPPITAPVAKRNQAPSTTSEPERMKRLTIDIPLSLHRAIKVQCAGRDTKIADEIRELLLRKYGKS